jgi:hypothetical protein
MKVISITATRGKTKKENKKMAELKHKIFLALTGCWINVLYLTLFFAVFTTLPRIPMGRRRSRRYVRVLIFGAVFSTLVVVSAVQANDGGPNAPAQPNLVNQANAPISSIFQIRCQDSYAPQFSGVNGHGNTFSIAVTMPLPKYRLLPFPQLSLLTIPSAVTVPNGKTGFGDLRFVDIAILHEGHSVIWGVGPAFVFPTASTRVTGQGKWQAGPAVAVAFVPERWLVGILAQNLISFGGDPKRADVNVMILQPFVTFQLGRGWFLRSQPQMVFDWETDRQLLPVDLGLGRVFKIGRQNVSYWVETFRNLSYDGPAPKYGVTFGVSLLYPDFWRH